MRRVHVRQSQQAAAHVSGALRFAASKPSVDSQLGVGATTADPPSWLIQPSDFAHHGLPFDPLSHVNALTSIEGSKLGAAFGRFDELQEYIQHLSHDRTVQSSIAGNKNSFRGSSRRFFLENAKVPCDHVLAQGSATLADMVGRVYNPANLTSASSLSGGFHDRARSFEALCRLEALLQAATEQLLSANANNSSASTSNTSERFNAALFPESATGGIPGEIRAQLAVVSAAKIHFLTQQQVPHLAIRQRLHVDREVAVLAARGLSLLFGCSSGTMTGSTVSGDSGDMPASLSFMNAPRSGTSGNKPSQTAAANLQRSIEQAGLEKEVIDTAVFLVSQFVAATARLKEISYDEGTYEGDRCHKAGATWTVREVFAEAAESSKEAREMTRSSSLVGSAETYSSIAQMAVHAPQLTLLTSHYHLLSANEHIDALIAVTAKSSQPLIASKLAVSQSVLEVLRTGHLPNALKHLQRAKMLLPHATGSKGSVAVGGGHGTAGATDNAQKLQRHMATMGNEQQRGLHIAGGLLMALEGDLESRRSEWSYGPNKVDASVLAVYQTALEYYSLNVDIPTGENDKGTGGKTLEQKEDDVAMLELSSESERQVYFAVRRAEREAYASSLFATGNFFLNAPRPAAKSDNTKDARVFVEPGNGMRGGPSTLTYMQSLLVATRAGSALKWSESKFEDPMPFDAAMKKAQQQLEKSLTLTRSLTTTDLEDGTNDGGDPHNLKAAYILRSLACVYSETKDYLYATGLFGSVERTFMHHYGSDSMEMLDLFSLQEQYQRQIGATREGEQTFKKMKRIVDVRRGLGVL